MRPATLVKLSVSLSVMMTVAAASAVFYANDASALRGEPARSDVSHADEPTAATIAAWKATARASDYLSPQVPI
jgi:hypothetical protein